jgi:hypothetical protein
MPARDSGGGAGNAVAVSFIGTFSFFRASFSARRLVVGVESWS